MTAQRQTGWRRLFKVMGWGLGYALVMAVPGAILGFIGGLFNAYVSIAVASGIVFFLLYPAWRRKRGPGTDIITYFLAMSGGVGLGVSCYLVGAYTA
jgi:hypothetical protein